MFFHVSKPFESTSICFSSLQVFTKLSLEDKTQEFVYIKLHMKLKENTPAHNSYLFFLKVKSKSRPFN